MQNAELKMQNAKGREEYFAPKIELIKIDAEDVITTSPGTETTPKEDNDGLWDLDMG